MASTQQAVQAATAAKVIRIAHSNHAAASDYLHGLKVTSGETRIDSRDELRCMDTDEYTDLVEDLSSSQKTALFDKIARMNEKPSQTTSELDKDITKQYFKALGLKSMGLSFKDVRKEVKKAPTLNHTTPIAPTTPPSKRAERTNAVENKKSKDKKGPSGAQPSSQASHPAPAAAVAPTSQKAEKSKKRKREENTPKAKKSISEAATKDNEDRISKKQKTAPVQPLPITADQGLTRDQRKRKRRRELKRAVLANNAAGNPQSASTTVAKKEHSEPQASDSPLASIDNNGQEKSEPITEKNHVAEALVSENIPPSDAADQIEPKKKKVRRSKNKAKSAKNGASESTELADVPEEEGPSHPAAQGATQVEGKKRGRRNRHKSKTTEPVVEAAVAEESSEDEAPDQENEFLRSAMRTTLPVTGKPTISAIADPTDDEDEVIQSAPEDLEQLPQSSPAAVQPEALPSPETRETSVSLHGQECSSSSERQQRSPSPLERKSDPVMSDGLPKPQSPSVSPQMPRNNLQQDLRSARLTKAPTPLKSNSFSLSQSSTGRPKQIPSASEKAPSDAFRDFNRFINGNDSSDEESESSSDSSDDDEEQASAPAQARAPMQASSSKDEPSEMPTQQGSNNHSPPLPQDESDTADPVDTMIAPEPSAMEIDTDLGSVPDVVTNNHEDPPKDEQSQPLSQVESEDTKGDKSAEADSITFRSFHEKSSPFGAPEPSPLPEIPDPDDLMEFGGYKPEAQNGPLAEEEVQPESLAEGEIQQEQDTREPTTRENHEKPDLTNSANSSNLIQQPGADDQVEGIILELNRRNELAVAEQDDELDAKLTSEVIAEKVEDSAQSSNLGTEKPAALPPTAQPSRMSKDPMADFAQAWEEEQGNFDERICEFREKLEKAGDGSAESNMAMIEKIRAEVLREEEVYKSKIKTSHTAVDTRVIGPVKAEMLDVIDRAGAGFDHKLIYLRAGLDEEYNAEAARCQLSQKPVDQDVEMKDVSESEDSDRVSAAEPTSESESESKSESSDADNDWAPTEDEGLTESARQRKKRKTTGTKSKHFASPSPKKRVPAGTSAVPFPKLSAPRFGLIQERLAHEPFRLLIAVTFLNKTAGRSAVPIFEKVMERYPTPEDLAAADIKDLSEMIHNLGLQNQRAKKLIKIAETWLAEPPQKGKLFRAKDYPSKGDSSHLGPRDTINEDVQDCIGALEIAHIYGLGPYAWDSWRIFCRDKFRGVAKGYNGEGVDGYDLTSHSIRTSDFEPEWKRVVPLDKELRACLRWMWLREGWEWDPLTGKKKLASADLMAKASEGIASWDEPVAPNPPESDNEHIEQIAEELEGPNGPEALVPGVKAKNAAAPARTTRATRAATPVRKQMEMLREVATPATTRAQKAAAAIANETITSRLRPRRGRNDAVVAEAVPATPSRLRARK